MLLSYWLPKKPINTTQSNDNGKNSELRSTNRNVVYDDEYKAYLQFKASQASSSATITHIGLWVLDSGASDHVFGNPYLLSKMFQPKTPYHITFADGSKANASGIGQATPLSSLSLDYALLFLIVHLI